MNTVSETLKGKARGEPYPSSDVLRAVLALDAKQLKRVLHLVQRAHGWSESIAGAPTFSEAYDEALTKIENGERNFYKGVVNIDDPRSVANAFTGILCSVLGVLLKKYLKEANLLDYEAQEIDERGSDPLWDVDSKLRPPLDHDPSPTSRYSNPVDEVLIARETFAVAAERTEAFMASLAASDPLLHKICQMRIDGLKNREIAAVLNIDNKAVGDRVTTIRRKWSRVFESCDSEVRQRRRRA